MPIKGGCWSNWKAFHTIEVRAEGPTACAGQHWGGGCNPQLLPSTPRAEGVDLGANLSGGPGGDSTASALPRKVRRSLGGLSACSHLDGGTDEASPAVHLQHTLKELVPLGLVVGEATLGQVDGLGHATCEVHQRIRGVASIQGLVTARQPGEKCGKNSQLTLPSQSKSLTFQGRFLGLREVKHTAEVTQQITAEPTLESTSLAPRPMFVPLNHIISSPKFPFALAACSPN